MEKMTVSEIMAQLQVDVYATNRALELFQGFSDCPTIDQVNDLSELFNINADGL